MENIIIPNPKKLKAAKQAISKDGAEKLHFLADFDRTLTHAFFKGEKVSSVVSILRKEKYLTPDYPEKAHALFNYYNPIEMNLSAASCGVSLYETE